MARALLLSNKAQSGERLDVEEMAELVTIATSMLPPTTDCAAHRQPGGGAANGARGEGEDQVVANVAGMLFPNKRGTSGGPSRNAPRGPQPSRGRAKERLPISAVRP